MKFIAILLALVVVASAQGPTPAPPVAPSPGDGGVLAYRLYVSFCAPHTKPNSSRTLLTYLHLFHLPRTQWLGRRVLLCRLLHRRPQGVLRP